jgi:hypothetical protein
MNRYFAYARVLTTGGPLGGATITVYNTGTFNLALIYDDDLPTPTAKANPFIADSNGYFFFYAAAGEYDIRISGGSANHAAYTWGEVVVTEVHAQDHVLATATALGPHHTVSGLTTGHVLTAITATTAKFQALPAGATPDHGSLTGLTDDDHSQYPLLAGRLGGQDLFGSTVEGQSLDLRGSSAAQSGPVRINPEGYGNVGIHLSSPSNPLSVAGKIQSTSGGFVFPDGTVQITASGAGTPSTWTINGDHIYNANIGFIGIGFTTTPIRQLQVADTANYQLRLTQLTAPGSAGLEITGNGTVWAILRATSIGVKLGVGDGDGIFVDSLGQIGIGTESPSRNLHVIGNAASGGATGIQIRVESEVGYTAGVGLWQSTTFLGDFSADANRIGLFALDGLGLALDQGTDRLGVGLASGDATLAKLHVKGQSTDDILLRLEAVDDQEPMIDFYTEDGRVGLIHADDQYFRLGNGDDLANFKLSQSTGYVIVAPTAGVPSGSGTTMGIDPARRLSVVGTSAEDFQLSLESPTAGGLELRTPSGVVGSLRASDTAVELSSINGTVIYIDQSNDAVGIGTTSPSGTYALDVAGQVHATSFPTSSDERFKDISTMGIEGALDKICRLSGVRFHWNAVYKKMGRARGSDSEEIGIIAQSLKKEFPELVSSWDDGEETYYGVEYGRLSAVLLEAIKQLRGELCQIKEQVQQVH